MNKKRIIVFDFDKTLTKKDTLLGFFLSVSRKNLFFPFAVLLYFWVMVFARLRIISNSTLKKNGIKLFLYSLSRSDLERRSKKYAKKIALSRVYNEVFRRGAAEASLRQIIVSASFRDYIVPLALGCEVFAAEIGWKDSSSHPFLFSNCYRQEKKQILEQHGIHRIDELYTDSISDLSLANMAMTIYSVKGAEIIKCDSVEEFLKVI